MVKWWMGHFGSSTPKRHYAFANSAQIHRVDMGKLEGWKSDPRIKKKSADRYRDAAGQLRYKGNENLRGTECLGDRSDFMFLYLLSFPVNDKGLGILFDSLYESRLARPGSIQFPSHA